ncbi:MAG: hypothetical protein KKA55_09085 [Proteobacteria bacterium]|nr:hypothetical protein [Pseudomonadota bacterium]MBU1595670.1 hypothetical protein [Pseudomonadota bacterium]
MPIDHWLSILEQPDHSGVDGDLEALGPKAYPFLTEQCSSNQIESLSGHLGALKCAVRRQVIAYTLYIRQLDIILESGPRAYCAGHCPNPPAGCCNRDHFVILNMTDLMNAQGSPTALHMAHVIGRMQKLESAHNGRERSIRPGYCSCLAEDGCTLRLFKSPRCAHYLCEQLGQAMQQRHEGGAALFLEAMRYTVGSTISSPEDFTNPGVIAHGAALYLAHPDQTRAS